MLQEPISNAAPELVKFRLRCCNKVTPSRQWLTEVETCFLISGGQSSAASCAPQSHTGIQVPSVILLLGSSPWVLFLPTWWKLSHQHHVQAGGAEWRASNSSQGNAHLFGENTVMWPHPSKGRQESGVSSLVAMCPTEISGRASVTNRKKGWALPPPHLPHPVLLLNFSQTDFSPAWFPSQLAAR